MRLAIPSSLLALAVALGALADDAKPYALELEELPVAYHHVDDPLASADTALALPLTALGGAIALTMPDKTFPPGRYRVVVAMRSPMVNGTLMAGTTARLSVRAGDEVLASRSCGRYSYSGPGGYEDLALTVLLRRPTPLSLGLNWSRPAEVADKAAAETKATADDLGKTEAPPDPEGLDAGIVALALNDVAFPCLLADRVTVERLGGEVVIERVWPEKVHCAPGEENPIVVTLANVGNRPHPVRLRLGLITGLDERSVIGERTVTAAPAASTAVRFDWTAGERQYGHKVGAELYNGDKLLERATEYFGVSRNVWQVAIQSPGFIEWAPQASKIDRHVADSRRAYTNVFEAFSWAPCSFSDLTPETDEWWSGQNNFHNRIDVLRQWMRLAHANGMKMITYSWPAASGAIGMEFARRHPDWVTNVKIGLGISYSVRDLQWRRWARAEGRPFLATVSRQWHSAGIDRGNLGAIDYGAREIVRSAQALGWDGVRFDNPWTWSAINGKDVQRQLNEIGAKEAAANVFPKLHDKVETWTGDEISYRNIKWARHVMSSAIPGFVFSYNYARPLDQPEPGASQAFVAACANGGQIMDERLRQYAGPWRKYAGDIRRKADVVRGLGGHFLVVGLSRDGLTELDRVYMKIFALAGRAHPYLATYQWGKSPTGTYSQFATRYSELLWDPGWQAVDNAAEVLAVQSEHPVWWREHAAWRAAGDNVQLLCHLITAPPTQRPYQAASALPLRQRRVRVTFKGLAGKRRVLSARAFSAEPRTRSMAVELETGADGTTAVVPEHHYWTVLWLEAAK